MLCSPLGSFKCNLIHSPFFEWRREKGLVHIACTCAGSPQKNLGESDIIVYPSVYKHISMHACRAPRSVIMETQLVAMEMPAHAHAMCTRPFSLLPSKKGPGYEASINKVLCALYIAC